MTIQNPLNKILVGSVAAPVPGDPDDTGVALPTLFRFGPSHADAVDPSSYASLFPDFGFGGHFGALASTGFGHAAPALPSSPTAWASALKGIEDAGSLAGSPLPPAMKVHPALPDAPAGSETPSAPFPAHAHDGGAFAFAAGHVSDAPPAQAAPVAVSPPVAVILPGQPDDAAPVTPPAQARPVSEPAGALPPGMADGAPAISMAGFAAGYNPSTDTSQWNFAKLFGTAAKAQSMLAQYNGQGVHVADYDDGIDKTVKALMTHYDASRELVINGVKADPGVLGGAGSGIHGTATNGIIGADAAQTDGKVTGLAYGAYLTDVNVFYGAASGGGMLGAIKAMSSFDVTNNSWGWTSKWADLSTGSASFGGQLVANLGYAATTGRGGLGTAIVKSAGNDWLTDHRDAATQMFNTDRHVIVTGAVADNDDVAFYSQRGASVLTSGPSNGGSQGITTTDRTGAAGYSAGDTTNAFGGTSAAAPEVTSVIADMLGANGKLGARDIQNILALSSHDNETAGFTTAATGNMAYGWTVNKANGFNGGGYHFSNDEGFGELNAHDAIREALAWSYMNPVAQTFNNEVHLSATAAGKAVPATASGASFAFAVSGAETVENASVTLNVSTANLDHLKVILTSPGGTQSIVLDTSTTLSGESGNSATGGANLTLSSHAFLGEQAQGNWTMQVVDTTTGDNVKVNSATLDLYGSAQSQSHQFHYTDEAAKMDAADPARVTLHDKGGVGSWIDTAPMTGAEAIDLHSGASSTLNGRTFLTIGTDTTVNKVTLGDGPATVKANDNGDTVVMGGGIASVTGGAGNDTFVFGGQQATVTGGGGKDSFVFDHANFGKAIITDFTSGQDVLDLRGLHDTFAGLKIADTGSTITISNIDAQGSTIVLNNTHGHHLTSGDFLFA